MERLILYAWPGNVRQLQNEVRRIVAMADPGTILQPAVPVCRDSADHVRGNSGFGETQGGECGHVDRRKAHSRPVTHRTRNDHDGAARSPRQGGCGRAGARHLTQGTLSEAPAARPLKAMSATSATSATSAVFEPFAPSASQLPRASAASIDSSRTRCDPHRVRIVLSRPSRMR